MLMFKNIEKNNKEEEDLNNTLLKIQNGNTRLLNELIDSYKPFVAKTVSSVCKRYINESDDEFSIGLIAFNDAIQKYSTDKGTSLLSFAEVIIKNRVIDFIRKQARYQNTTVHLNHYQNNLEDDSATNQIEAELSYKDYLHQLDKTMRRDEISHFTQLLKEYGLSFQDLVKQSPKHADARKTAMSIAQTIASDSELKNYLLEKKRLPIKFLVGNVEVSRKTIERNRKYIMAIALIIINEYSYLKDYIKGVLDS